MKVFYVLDELMNVDTLTVASDVTRPNLLATYTYSGGSLIEVRTDGDGYLIISDARTGMESVIQICDAAVLIAAFRAGALAGELGKDLIFAEEEGLA